MSLCVQGELIITFSGPLSLMFCPGQSSDHILSVTLVPEGHVCITDQPSMADI
jgi:hypothetical protein